MSSFIARFWCIVMFYTSPMVSVVHCPDLKHNVRLKVDMVADREADSEAH